jgi:hypothetical protein
VAAGKGSSAECKFLEEILEDRYTELAMLSSEYDVENDYEYKESLLEKIETLEAALGIDQFAHYR